VGADASYEAPAPRPDPRGGETVAPSWGPTDADLEKARRIVSRWDADRLAGQMIVAGYPGSDPATPARLVRELHLAGIALNGGNVAGGDQVRATARAVAAAARADGRSFPPVVATDQEGGVVEHLRGIAASYPPFSAAGHAVTDPRGGTRVVRSAMRAAGLELRWLGVNWVLGPVGDVTIGAGDPTIGSRSASSDPRVAARATGAAVRGYRAAGIVSTVKHFPGHGSVTADSHLVLPRLDSSLAQLERRDLRPFRSSVAAGAPVVMLAHVDVRALAPGRPSSLAPRVYRYLRRELGFEGVAMTDALEMGAVATRGQDPALAALRAGADLVLIPPDTPAAHAAVAGAIRDGRLPRARAMASAARIVALQLWQQRRADQLPVGPRTSERARAAAQRLAGFQ
jgi:beta-N-acetylhexosaminidase